MYLKSIVMQGFKSFANKMTLEFHEGITGIVGPNGSGKSNVADAVRWVLGEQSAKQLRGGNMQDVIFAGTEMRKALGFAMVAITFDNRDRKLNFDADEITVSRRLYRSGESEYMMNARSCRLRDIQELFFDTGIGKEGYSIIGQGQIDKILNGRPDDRRELFDEAAGIVKFKRRKAAALKKLESEQANLVRVNDILSVLEGQVGPLKKQSEKAEQYLMLRDKLCDIEISLFYRESLKLEEQLSGAAESLKIADAHHKEADLAFESTKREYEELEQALSEIEEEITSLRESNAEQKMLKQQLESRIDILRERISASERNDELYRERMDAIREEKERRSGAIVDIRREQEQQQADFKEIEKRRGEHQEKLDKLNLYLEKLTADSEKNRSDTISLLNKRGSIKEKIQRYDTMLEQIDIRKAEITAEMLRHNENTALQAKNQKELEEQFTGISELIRSMEEQSGKNEQRLEKYKKDIAVLNHDLEIGQTAFHRESSRLESLRNLAERYEGYGNSVKRVMARKDDNPGIHGVIADLITTKKRYETAIETALGGSLQNIVTDNENTAKYLIEYLKRGHYGRATFLPLTTVKSGRPFQNERLLEENGVIGLASTLIACDPLYNEIVERLLGNTVVVENIDRAIAIGRKYKHSVRMVTLEGDLLNPGGSMTGGAYKSNSNLLGRKREIDDLEKSVRMLKSDMEAASGKVDSMHEARNRLRDKQNQLNDDLQKKYLQQNTIRINLESTREKTDEMKDEYLRLQQEKQELERQVAQIKESKAEVSAELDLSESEEDRLSSDMKQAAETISSVQQEIEDSREHLEKINLEYTALSQKSEFLKERIRSEEQETLRLSQEENVLLKNQETESKERTDKETEIRRLTQKSEKLGRETDERDDEIRQLVLAKDKMNEDHRAFFRKRDEISEERSRMDKECFRLNAQIERLEERREEMITNLWEEYQITPDQAEKLSAGDESSQSMLKQSAASLKKEIRELGNVNVNAIEEYKEKNKEYIFLSGQKQDLTKAAETLQDIIRKLEEGMRKQFREKFEEIKIEYDKVFQELFGGGKGTLDIVEEEDILDAGIIINAQPPGKKLQNMMQLSGGEKALTAIALLFAIQNLKPSPFCLLDEIEAALDDANVGHYAEYLHKLTKHTQFIIITHRRGSMAAADRLYGITMQEKGVSALVSVNLIENELDA